MKATLCQLLIVICLSSIVSNVTPVPPPQELSHCNEDAGGGRIAMPPHPPVPAAPTASPTPQRGFSFSSPLHYSVHAEPRQSATWTMINAAGCGAKSSPSGGAVVPIRGRACRLRPGPGGQSCGGVAKGAAPGSGVRGGGRGMGLQRGRHRHRAWRNKPASPPAGQQESQTRTCAGQRHGSANASALWA